MITNQNVIRFHQTGITYHVCGKSRLIPCDDNGVAFKWKDYRAKGQTRHKVMTLASHEFIRRFLIHVLPQGFHRIRHYGLFANATRAPNLVCMRQLLGVAPQPACQNQRQIVPTSVKL